MPFPALPAAMERRQGDGGRVLSIDSVDESRQTTDSSSVVQASGESAPLWLSLGNHSHSSSHIYHQQQHQDSSISANPYHIVLYKGRQIVVYNPYQQRIGAQCLTSVEEEAIRVRRLARCPMCSQVVDLQTFSFMASSYFHILHEVYMRQFHQRNSSPTGQAAPMATNSGEHGHEAAGAAEATNPFIVQPPADGGPPESGGQPVTKNIPPGLLVTGYYDRFFIEIRKLGSGSYGQVYLCRHVLDDLSLGDYAVKKVPVGDDRQWLRNMIREVKIREKLHHPNIVDYKHSWLEMHRQSEFCVSVPWLFVLMEFCNAGNLEDFVWDARNGQPQYLTDMQIWKLFLDACLGLQHLHHMGILHRDLKPSNILLQYSVDELTNRQTCRGLLADFGTAELFSERARRVNRHGFTGTVEYTAPELLECDESGHYNEDYDVHADMWSLGILLYALCYAQVPYSDPDPQACRLKILAHTTIALPSHPRRGPDLQHLIHALTARPPALRPSTDDLLANPRIVDILRDANILNEASSELADMVRPRVVETDSAPLPRQPSRGNQLSRTRSPLLPFACPDPSADVIMDPASQDSMPSALPPPALPMPPFIDDRAAAARSRQAGGARRPPAYPASGRGGAAFDAAAAAAPSSRPYEFDRRIHSISSDTDMSPGGVPSGPAKAYPNIPIPLPNTPLRPPPAPPNG
ncbi:unnamed protein product [Vitrella brassicaformis CCMP3155]|uniref:non-specific serine/threonine protein kinase n=1 Tax=Vitrella brassicaformis (strain CCMP3155) TaxID=1169540 RepID=A0A0G4EK06_VITBC|nr:unnamed protein product [Vitrella brassicaformis CCMP3155]|eukprot:CEL96735.1 unnamed protein product [Vitrella brassicaformis CCMP3155]